MSIELLELAADALGPLLDEDGRKELVEEVTRAPADVRGYIASELDDLLTDPRIADGLFGALRPDAASQARADAIVMPRLRRLMS